MIVQGLAITALLPLIRSELKLFNIGLVDKNDSGSFVLCQSLVKGFIEVQSQHFCVILAT